MKTIVKKLIERTLPAFITLFYPNFSDAKLHLISIPVHTQGRRRM